MEEDAELAVRIVVAEGILSEDEARALRDEAARGGQGVLERLHANGRISEPTFASLHANMTRQAKEELGEQVTVREGRGAHAGDDGRTWAPLAVSGAAPGDRADPDVFPVPGWNRYEPIRLLGQGGMGRVFLARDLRLGRNVAIKFVRGDDPELARRIVGEARAQARVNDERVCKVYEVGEVRGRVYIAMQHIDGRPLSELTAELTFEQKAIVMRGAALGVAEAHRVGLIHRDLKPSNVMVERGAAGELRPFVMDFGLARDWADGTTMTGTVLGTPHYMAPEQARGEVKQLDRRADVYSLGATLYALLVGRVPIEGSNPLVVLTRVATEVPTRPRAIDPDVPADLEAIAMKCLEKERADRYDSARSLADDLGRFLGGEPVAARSSAGVGYRLRKWLRRRFRLVASVTVAVVVVAVALGFGLRERWRAGRRADLARRFTERVEHIELAALASALAPAHDLGPDRRRLRGDMDALAADIQAEGDLAAAPGHYALGRGYLALDDDDRAATELAAAWEGGSHEPRVAYALALAQGRLYQRALREVERSELPKEQRAQRRREVEQRYRDPALRYLRESDGPDVPSALVAALIAFYEDRFDVALAQLDALEQSDQARAWSYEVPLLRGEVLHARAEAKQGAAAAADLEAGRHALVAAAAIGRSVPAVHREHAELELTALWVEQYSGGAVDAPYNRGVDAAERVLALLPDDAGALVLRARLQRRLAEHRSGRGEDVTELLTGAVADARRAVALEPERRGGRLALASIYRQWGEVTQKRGQDPSEQLRQAVQILDSIPKTERRAEYHVVLGLVHKDWANHEDGTGVDSTMHRRRAIDAFEQAVQTDERFSVAWLNLGDNYRRRASRSHSPDLDLARAGKALSRARELEPTNFYRYLYEGDLYSTIADRKQGRGDDPDPDRARAIELYQQGSVVNRSNVLFHHAISNEHLLQAEEARRHGHDPLPVLALAAAAAGRAIELAPRDAYGYINHGTALLERARYQRDRGNDPMPAARDAEPAFRQALELHPDLQSIWELLFDLHILVARAELEQGRDPRGRLKLAEKAIAALNLSEADALKHRNQIRALLDRNPARRRGEDARDPVR
jgi:eukaryotic-like serine/threonine-protein kinase